MQSLNKNNFINAFLFIPGDLNVIDNIFGWNVMEDFAHRV